ncbi:hypothetical protein IJI31_02595 [bacterium]|nr:hypothetical protein [bacterium]
MGMAASQVRFLTLQDRKSQIGMRLGILSNRKMALTRDQNKAAQAYNEAYSQTTLQWYDSINGNYTDITYNAMMSPNVGNSYTPFLITDRSTGRVILDGGQDVAALLGHGGPSSASTAYWNGEDSPFPAVSNSTALSGTMPYHMERLTGVTGDHYIPSSVSYDQVKMAPYIIEQMMGISNFDRDRISYKAVENEDITIGGYQKVDHSEFIKNLKTEVTTDVSDRSSVRVPVWEYNDHTSSYSGILHMGMNILNGDMLGVFSQHDHNGADANGWGGSGSYCDTHIWTDTYNGTDIKKQRAYIDDSGNVHQFTGKEYWSTLYDSNAVIITPADVNTGADGDKDKDGNDSLYSVNYNWSTTYSRTSNNIKAIAKDFVTAVNDSGMLKYDMSDYISSIADATQAHMMGSYDGTNGGESQAKLSWNDEYQANVDTNLYIRVTKMPDDLQYRSNGERVDWDGEKGILLNRGEVEYTVVSGQQGQDPVGFGTDNGTDSITLAIVRQANAIASPIRVNAANWEVDSKDNARNLDPDDAGADSVMAFSLKVLMDVAMYYITLTQEKLAAVEGTNNNPNITADSLMSIPNAQYGFEEYMAGNHGKDGDYFTEVSNYSTSELEIFQQGETKVASVRSMLSNLEMLKEKADHCSTLDGFANNPVSAIGNYDVDEQGHVNSSGIYGDLKTVLLGILNGEDGYNLDDERLIELANINKWMCDALKQDYSTYGGLCDVKKWIDNIQKAMNIYQAGGFTENNWNAQQVGPDGDGYAYDGPTMLQGSVYSAAESTPWNRRKQLFSQTSTDAVATKQLDIDGQLNIQQLHQFKFYENLVKECLARGWKNQDKVDTQTTTLHMQNGTWLINDTMAKSSSRVFEVTNKEAREVALSKYEALQTELKIKEERIDTQMEKLETEQNAIKTELDGLQSVIKDNINMRFKIFTA